MTCRFRDIRRQMASDRPKLPQKLRLLPLFGGAWGYRPRKVRRHIRNMALPSLFHDNQLHCYTDVFSRQNYNKLNIRQNAYQCCVCRITNTSQTRSLSAGFGRHGMPPPGSNDTDTVLDQEGSD